MAAAGPCYWRLRVSKLLKEGHQARVYSDQMVLMMARREAGPVPGGCSRTVFYQAKAKGDYQA